MLARQGSGKGGAYTDADIARFCYHLFEIDSVPLELQLSLFCKINVPITLISDSGGRSYHALVKSFARTRSEYEAESEYLHEIYGAFGVDPKNRNPSRYSRLPGVPARLALAHLKMVRRQRRRRSCISTRLLLKAQFSRDSARVMNTDLQAAVFQQLSKYFELEQIRELWEAIDHITGTADEIVLRALEQSYRKNAYRPKDDPAPEPQNPSCNRGNPNPWPQAGIS